MKGKYIIYVYDKYINCYDEKIKPIYKTYFSIINGQESQEAKLKLHDTFSNL